MAKAVLNTADDYILCNECGTQYPLTADSGKDECKICDVRISPNLYKFRHTLLTLIRTHDSMFQPTVRRLRHWRN